jgi:ADP-heptose:LPS heptosyltransferase
MSKAIAHVASATGSKIWYWWIIRLITGFESFAAYVVGRFFFSIGGVEQKSTASNTIERILVVRLDGVGDLVMTSGFLRVLRGLFPKARVVLVVKKELVNLVELCPYVDAIKQFGTHSWRIMQPVVLPWRTAVFARRFLAPYHFNLAINPRWDTDGHYAGFMTYFSGAIRRVGYSEKVNARKRYFNQGFDKLYTVVVENREPKHEFERNLDVIQFLGGDPKDCRPELWLSPEDKEFAETVCKFTNKQYLVALGAGAGHPRRIWPIENFVAVGQSMQSYGDVSIVLLGSEQETEMCNDIARSLTSGAVNMAGRTTLRQAAAVMSRCNVFVGNDSGLMHIASAVGTPVVEISCHPRSGSATDVSCPTRFGPWNERKVILQPTDATPPCTDRCAASIAHCIKAISAELVLSAINSFLSRDQKNNSKRRASSDE